MAKDTYIQLPAPSHKGNISLEETIYKRRSQRRFTKTELTEKEVSQLLWAAGGITYGRRLRASPSAGALYPMEIYLLSKDGLFHYLPQGHKLELWLEGDSRRALAVSAFFQNAVADAPVDILICVVYQRITKKYGERGIRYAHIEAGHIAQNIHLQAQALGLGSVPIGAFSDAEVKKNLKLPADNQPLYIIPVGYADSK